MKTIIIGGGAAGMMAAIYSKDAIILEKNNSLGKKILITGNGKCNYYNENQNIDNYNTNNIDALKQIININNTKKILNQFDNMGIIPKIKNGYYYPESNQAVSIQNTLLKEIENNNTQIYTNTEVLSVEYNNKFIIKTNNGVYESDKLIVATGSKACPKTGSDGFGYELLKRFGHTVIKPLPALVQLKGNGNYFKDWAGIRCDVKVSYENKTEEGEIQLTDYGVSGVCIFNLSSKIARDLENKPVYININFVPFLNINTKEQLKEFFNERNKTVKNRNISELLDGFLNYKLGNLLLKLSGIKNNYSWNDLSDIQKNNLMNNLLNFKLEIIGTNSFDKAQTCSGGIPLDEINPKTMESLKQKDLYIVGELLDVDGKCGGYNLTFAFITGMLAGEDND